MKEIYTVVVECKCGWKFGVQSLDHAVAIFDAHDCGRFVLTGKDNEAIKIGLEKEF